MWGWQTLPPGTGGLCSSKGMEIPSEQTLSLEASPRAEILGPGPEGYHCPPWPRPPLFFFFHLFLLVGG